LYQQLNNFKFIAGSKQGHLLLDLLFDTEDGADTVQQNVGFLADCTDQKILLFMLTTVRTLRSIIIYLGIGYGSRAIK
jgi:hypothetical protein